MTVPPITILVRPADYYVSTKEPTMKFQYVEEDK